MRPVRACASHAPGAVRLCALESGAQHLQAPHRNRCAQKWTTRVWAQVTVPEQPDRRGLLVTIIRQGRPGPHPTYVNTIVLTSRSLRDMLPS